MTDMTFTAVTRRVVQGEIRMARDYAVLVDLLDLTVETTSADLTAAARQVVLAGAPASLNLSVDDLTGRDPGADAKVRPYWKAARAVRIGLVKAIGADDTEPEAKPAALRVSLSGEGGGSATVPMDSALGKAILEFLAQGK